MAWPSDLFAELKISEKKYLALFATPQLLKRLRFSDPQRTQILLYKPFAVNPIKPKFLVSNPLSVYLSNQADAIMASTTGLTYLKWSIKVDSEEAQQHIESLNALNQTMNPQQNGLSFWTTSTMASAIAATTPMPQMVMNLDLDVEEDSEDGPEDGPLLNNSFNQLDNTGIIDPDNNEETNSNIDNPSNCHDLTVRYSDCFGVRGGRVVRTLEFSSYSDTESNVLFRLIDENGSSSDVESKRFNDSFDMTLPVLGMVNFKDHVIYVQRRHKKSSPSKYRKALRADTIQYTNLSVKELLLLNRADITKDYSEEPEFVLKRVAHAIFFPEQYDYEEALQSVTSFNRLATAFSSSMAIKLDSVTNKIVLQKNSWIIGIFNPKDNRFEMVMNTFNSQLDDLKIPFKAA